MPNFTLKKTEVIKAVPLVVNYQTCRYLLSAIATRIGHLESRLGWDCDVWACDWLIITTGYRAVGVYAPALQEELERLDLKVKNGHVPNHDEIAEIRALIVGRVEEAKVTPIQARKAKYFK